MRRGKRHTLLSGRRSRRGISLLEVMLAIAILGMSMVVIGQMISTGSRAAIRARDLTQAQIHAESVMSQVVSGVLLPEAVASAPMETYDMSGDWMYSVDVQPGTQEGMLIITVAVQKTIDSSPKPLIFMLNRLMIDPEFEAMMLAGEEMDTTDSADSDASSSDSSSSSSDTGATQ